jgi:hypothetical protein
LRLPSAQCSPRSNESGAKSKKVVSKQPSVESPSLEIKCMEVIASNNQGTSSELSLSPIYSANQIATATKRPTQAFGNARELAPFESEVAVPEDTGA